MKLPHRKFVWKKNFFAAFPALVRSGLAPFRRIFSKPSCKLRPCKAAFWPRSFCMDFARTFGRSKSQLGLHGRVLERVPAGTGKKDLPCERNSQRLHRNAVLKHGYKRERRRLHFHSYACSFQKHHMSNDGSAQTLFKHHLALNQIKCCDSQESSRSLASTVSEQHVSPAFFL